MATYKSIGTRSVSTGSITVSIPSSRVAGDLLILLVYSKNESVSIPSGWQIIEKNYYDSRLGTPGQASANRVTIFWRISDGTETSVAVSDTGNLTIGQVVVFGEVPIRNPIRQVERIAPDIAGINLTKSFPQITVDQRNAIILYAASLGVDQGISDAYTNWQNSSGYTVTEIADGNTSTGNGGGMGIAYVQVPEVGSSGTTRVDLASASSYTTTSIAIANYYNSVRFTGKFDSYISRTGTQLNISTGGSKTFEMFLKVDQFDQPQVILDTRTNTTTNYQLAVLTSGLLELTWKGVKYTSTIPVEQNKYNHVALVFSGSNLQFFIRGNPSGSYTISSGASPGFYQFGSRLLDRGYTKTLPSGTYRYEDFYVTPDVKYIYVLDTVGNFSRYTFTTTGDFTSGLGSQTGTVITNGTGFTFKPDGTIRYSVSNTGTLIQFNLTSPWEFFTSSQYTFETGLQAGKLIISSNGLNLYISNYSTGEVYQYSFATAWDIRTLSLSESVLLPGVFSSPSGQSIQGFEMSPDGTRLYVRARTEFGFALVQYELTTPYAISTARYLSHSLELGVTQYLSNNIEQIAPFTAVRFNSTGTRLYLQYRITTNTIAEVELSTPFDISSAVLRSSSEYANLKGNISNFRASNEALYIQYFVTPIQALSIEVNTALLTFQVNGVYDQQNTQPFIVGRSLDPIEVTDPEFTQFNLTLISGTSTTTTSTFGAFWTDLQAFAVNLIETNGTLSDVQRTLFSGSITTSTELAADLFISTPILFEGSIVVDTSITLEGVFISLQDVSGGSSTIVRALLENQYPYTVTRRTFDSTLRPSIFESPAKLVTLEHAVTPNIFDSTPVL